MFELLLVIGLMLIIGVVVLAVKFLLFAVLLPLKIGAGLLKLFLFLVVGLPLLIVGVALLTAAIPVALVVIPVLLVLAVITLPFVLLLKLVF